MTQTEQNQQITQLTTEQIHHKHRFFLLQWLFVALEATVLGLFFAALPARLTFGPGWLPLVLIVIIILPPIISLIIHKPLPHVAMRTLGFALLFVVTAALAMGAVLLVITLPNRTEAQAGSLLRDAVLLWLSNILVFALWFWEIDGGGPRKRYEAGHPATDLQFPQQAQGNIDGKWAPHFLDYLFVAFTTATALSPTDTMPLTRKAKALVMIEALIALSITILIAARAVNIL
jgi:NADH:ubiquinone oxidoreductase subunit 3 (subunit A)